MSALVKRKPDQQPLQAAKAQALADHVGRPIEAVAGPDAQSLQEEEQAHAQSQGGEATHLIVNYLPKLFTEADINSLFSLYGTVTFVKVVRNRITRESECYGFINYSTPEEAAAAISSLNGYQTQGKRLKVSISQPKSQASPDGGEKANLYIAGFPLELTEAGLKEMCEAYGEVLETRVLYDYTTQKSRQCGFVRMATNEQANGVIKALNNSVQEGGRTLAVRFADKPKDAAARRQKLQQTASFYSPADFPERRMYPDERRLFGYAPRRDYGAFDYWDPLETGAYPVHRPSPPAPSGYVPPRLPPPLRGAMIGKSAQQHPGVCLFIYHLPQTATEAELRQLFSNYGVVLNVKIMVDPQTQTPKGFGFVNMQDLAQAELAIMNLNGYQMGSKYLQVSIKK